nr:BlaI/MecI/CopY family transcriptional regulator [Sphingomonas naasensis]
MPRREREVFEILCSLGEGTAAAVRGALAEPPSDSAVRTLLSRLAAKGLVAHRTVNQAYVYAPVAQAGEVAETALQRLVQTFFQGSAAQAATALLGMEPGLDAQEIDMLQRAIDKARKEAE